MSKKHFIELADLIRTRINRDVRYNCQNFNGTELEDRLMEDIKRALADFCIDQNIRFDRHRWLDYIAGECGKNGGKVREIAA